MSTSKVIFTYKRKRLSSHSGVGNADVCPDFSLDVQAGKHQAVLNESSEKDPMETFQVQRSDACNSTEMQHISIKLSEDSNFKASGKIVSTEATLQETTNPSCVHLDSTCPLIDGSIQGDLVSKLEEEPNSLSKHKSGSIVEKSKCKVTAPLLTFSRRLKRKDGAGSSVILVELPAKEKTVDVRESEAIRVLSTLHDVAVNEMQAVEKSSTLKVATDNVVNGNTSCQSREKIPIKESRDSSCIFTRSSSDIPALKQTVEKRCSQDDFIVDTSSGTKQSASALTSSDALETTTLPDNIVLKSSVDENSSCDDICKTDEQHDTNQCRTSSGDSQLTSSDFSDVKTFAEKAIQQTVSSALDISCLPPSGALLIDCNVIPKADLQEKESDTVQHSSAIAENRGKATQEAHLKGKGLALFGDTEIQVVDSPSTNVVRLGTDLHSPLVSENKFGMKYLQLFSEEPQNGHFAAASSNLETSSRPQQNFVQLFSEKRQNGQFAPASTNLGTSSRRPQQNATKSYDYNIGQFEQASRKAPATIGLSVAMDPVYESQTSRHNSGMRRFPDHNVGMREFIQNPGFQSFPDQPLLDTCNTRGTALRGPTVWSEEELDSLWIGVRRYGVGNWHAMLLDPKLRFAPWRVARDLAAQWSREESNILTGQHLPGGSGPCVSRDVFSTETRLLTSQHMPEARGPHVPRDFLSTETGLSLGDLYAGRDGNYFQSNGQNNLSHVQITLASTQFGNYNSTSFNTMHTSVTIGGDGMGMGMNPNNSLPRWLQEPTAPTPMFFEPPHPQMSAMPQTGGSRLVRPFSVPSGTSSKARNLNNSNCPGPTKGRQRMTENLIIIDSDASSEETVSDDRFMRN